MRWRASTSSAIVRPTPSRSSAASSHEQPQFAEGSVLLAEAQEATGAPDAAIETLTILLEDQPQFFRGRVQLAELYDRQRQWAEAAQAWAAVQKLNARNTEVMARRASR